MKVRLMGKKESMATPSKKRQPTGSSQLDAFKEAAREISGDQSEAEFDRALGQIGRANVPKDDVKPADRRKRAKRKPLKLGI